MNYVDGQFVVLPRLKNLTKSKLKYTDILTYTSLRSFDGDEGCFPSYESIASRAGCSRDFVIKSLKRLEKAGVIEIKRKRRIVRDRLPVNHYEFTKSFEFDPIPYSFFENKLSLNDKSMLLTLRQFFYNAKVRPAYQIKRISFELGVSYKVIHQRIESLVKLGYIKKLKVDRRKGSFQCKYQYTDKIDWIWDLTDFYRSKQARTFLLVS
jgi:predicted transcriptional regulator